MSNARQVLTPSIVHRGRIEVSTCCDLPVYETRLNKCSGIIRVRHRGHYISFRRAGFITCQSLCITRFAFVSISFPGTEIPPGKICHVHIKSLTLEARRQPPRTPAPLSVGRRYVIRTDRREIARGGGLWGPCVQNHPFLPVPLSHSLSLTLKLLSGTSL